MKILSKQYALSAAIATSTLVAIAWLLGDSSRLMGNSIGVGTLAQQQRPLATGMNFSSLHVSYKTEISRDNEKTWKLRETNSLFWDVANGKYRFSIIYDDKDLDGVVSTREYICVDGKWTFLLGKRKKVGDSLFDIPDEAPRASILPARSIPFYFPFSCLTDNDEKPFDFGADSMKASESEREMFYTVKVKSKASEYYLRDVFTFEKKGKRFLQRTEDIVDGQGRVVKKILEYTIPEGEYYDINGKIFPKKILYRQYIGEKYDRSILYTFSPNVQIDIPIKDKVFEVEFPFGTHVTDTLNNKAYTVSKNGSLSNDELIVKQLDEIFEKAKKSK